MAQCDEGYLCEVCGEQVSDIRSSDLYLRYVIGEIDSRELLASPERHIRCNPTLAQFIVDDAFEPVSVEGPFSKHELDEEDVRWAGRAGFTGMAASAGSAANAPAHLRLPALPHRAGGGDFGGIRRGVWRAMPGPLSGNQTVVRVVSVTCRRRRCRWPRAPEQRGLPPRP